MSQKESLRLDWASHEAMKYALKKWYYRDELPMGKLVKIGVWEDGVFSGVVVFGGGASDSLGTRYGLTPLQACEMVRIALRPDHKCSISRVLRIAIMFLRKKCPGIQLVLTYADPSAGHTGAVYQAANWVYLGRTSPDSKYLAPDGKWYHSRGVKASGWNTTLGGKKVRCPKPAECKRVRVPGKHKYGLALNDAVRALLLQDVKTKPKKEVESRGESIDSDAPGFPPGETRANRSSPLQPSCHPTPSHT